MDSISTIEAIEAEAKQIASGEHQVRPGLPCRIPEAATEGDEVWQGDLGFIVLGPNAEVPEGYKEQKGAVKLVPGDTKGARHCLVDPSMAKVYFPGNYSDADYEGLDGPFMQCTKETAVTHPTHGDVVIPKGMNVQLRYQREWDAELRRERRNAD